MQSSCRSRLCSGRVSLTALGEVGPRIGGAVAFCNKLQSSFAHWVTEPNSTLSENDAQVVEALTSIREAVVKIENLCREQEGVPGQLPTPTRRAYQWLKFLSEPGHLVQHLDALRKATEGARALPERKSLPAALQ